MKILKFVLGLVLVFSLTNLNSCGKSGNDPVDQYVKILEEATKKAEKINSMTELLNVQEIISPEDAMAIVSENANYQLTDSDKDKLKKCYEKLLKVAFEKTAEYGGLPENLKEQAKAQTDLYIEAAKAKIDNAKTLGELNGIR